MSIKLTAAIVAMMMGDAEPADGPHPWNLDYQATSEAIAAISNDSPLFGGPDGPMRTAALFVSLSWFESNFHVGALGDCRKKDDKGRCVADPQSVGLYQIGIGNLAGLHTTIEEQTTDALAATKASRAMIAISFGVCRGRAEDDLLGNYASGGSGCGRVGTDALVKSGHRMRKAKWLFEKAKKLLTPPADEK